MILRLSGKIAGMNIWPDPPRQTMMPQTQDHIPPTDCSEAAPPQPCPVSFSEAEVPAYGSSGPPRALPKGFSPEEQVPSGLSGEVSSGAAQPPVRVLSEAEEADFREFQRTKRETEIALVLRRLIVDLTAETDRAALKAGIGSAFRLHTAGVLLTPVQFPWARKAIRERGDLSARPHLIVLIGGTGDTLPSVKKYEAKKAVRQGAEELILLPSAFSLRGGTVQNIKRELRSVRRAAGRVPLTAAFSDRRFTPEEMLLGVKAAAAAGLCGVLVRGEPEEAEAASARSGLSVGVTGAENAEQLKLLFQAGAVRAVTACPERIAEELRLQAARAAQVK